MGNQNMGRENDKFKRINTPIPHNAPPNLRSNILVSSVKEKGKEQVDKCLDGCQLVQKYEP